jgi:hypothetical protein
MKRARSQRVLAAASIGAILALTGCAPLAIKEPRAADSSIGCMRAAIASHQLDELPDSAAHCIAAGLIARRCSVTEAMLASIGKEIGDAFGRGEAQWRDLSADRRGIRCARSADDEQELAACCAAEEATTMKGEG